MEKLDLGGFDGEAGINTNALILLFIAVFLDLFGFGIIVPILPFLATDLGASGLQYGLIIALYSLMQFIFAPLWGKLSDRVGRRPVIITGLGGSVIGFSIFGFATQLWIVYLARAVAGIFTAATLTTANAYIADLTPPKERGKYFGLIAAAFGLGFAVGPAVGGLLAEVTFLGISGYALPSFAAALTSLLNMIAALYSLPESLPEEERIKIDPKEGSIFPILDTFKLRKYPGVLLFITIFALTSLAFSNFIASFSIYAPRVDPSVNEPKLGWYFTYAGLLLVLTQSVIIRPLLDYFSEETVVKIGLVLFLIGFIALPQVSTFPMMFVTNTPLILGIGLLSPSLNSLVSLHTPQTKQGLVLGINQGWASFMRIFGPLIAGTLFDINIRYPFYFAAILFGLINLIAFTQISIEPVDDKSQATVPTFTSD